MKTLEGVFEIYHVRHKTSAPSLVLGLIKRSALQVQISKLSLFIPCHKQTTQIHKLTKYEYSILLMLRVSLEGAAIGQCCLWVRHLTKYWKQYYLFRVHRFLFYNRNVLSRFPCLVSSPKLVSSARGLGLFFFFPAKLIVSLMHPMQNLLHCLLKINDCVYLHACVPCSRQ